MLSVSAPAMAWDMQWELELLPLPSHNQVEAAAAATAARTTLCPALDMAHKEAPAQGRS